MKLSNLTTLCVSVVSGEVKINLIDLTGFVRTFFNQSRQMEQTLVYCIFRFEYHVGRFTQRSFIILKFCILKFAFRFFNPRRARVRYHYIRFNRRLSTSMLILRQFIKANCIVIQSKQYCYTEQSRYYHWPPYARLSRDIQHNGYSVYPILFIESPDVLEQLDDSYCRDSDLDRTYSISTHVCIVPFENNL